MSEQEQCIAGSSQRMGGCTCVEGTYTASSVQVAHVDRRYPDVLTRKLSAANQSDRYQWCVHSSTAVVNYLSPAAFQSHFQTAVVTATGTVYVMGDNSSRQLVNTPEQFIDVPRRIPPEVFGNDSVLQFAIGHRHSVVLTSNGSVYTFGCNSNGQLGDGTRTERGTPRLVSTIELGRDSVACVCGVCQHNTNVTCGRAKRFGIPVVAAASSRRRYSETGTHGATWKLRQQNNQAGVCVGAL